MKKFTEFLTESESQYAVVQKGGSIGEKSIRAVSDLRGMKVAPKEKLYDDKAAAKEKVKSMNKLLSPGEKKHYGIRYITAEVVNGKYTGKG